VRRARFPRPQAVRGLYANAWAAGSSARMSELLDIARRTEVNSLVIDIKDASGYVSHGTEVALAHEIGATGEIRIKDLAGLLDRLEEERIYPIARIVIVKDPVLAEFRPELAVRDTAGGVWVDSKGFVWLNPYARQVWDYHVDLAREVALLGFPEIQFDYVRFPDAPDEDLGRAVFHGADGRSKSTAIGEFLEYARNALEDLDAQLTADVFGVTTSVRRDVGIGQVWETVIASVDVALPMVYPSHYWEGSFGFTAPNAHPYEIVRRAVSDAVERSEAVDGAGRTRPWLQDFTLGAPPYTSTEVRAQIQATYDAGVDEWILWNPSSRYTESALEPVGGFGTEPLIRVGGRLARVSERFAVLDSVAGARAYAETPTPAAASGDEGSADGALPVDASPPDPAAPTASDSVALPLN
ncbi:MAG TPA: putative glycoside hydrolase, partial [Longimicrobiales bacterium]|nr:putative glycoside hydrolase [Longimicrobiales bacterium]